MALSFSLLSRTCMICTTKHLTCFFEEKTQPFLGVDRSRQHLATHSDVEQNIEPVRLPPVRAIADSQTAQIFESSGERGECVCVVQAQQQMKALPRILTS